MGFDIFTQFLIILCMSVGILCMPSNGSQNDIPMPDYSDLPRLEGRIVNGTIATVGQFPHQVSLRRSYSGAHFCGGSVISNEWILTAGHCMYKRNGVQISPWTITVVGGPVKLNESPSYIQKHAVEAIIVHQSFEGATLTNDVALLKLKRPLDLSTSYVKAAKLETTMPEPGTVCKVSGWGYLAENRPVVSNDLMYVSLPIIKPERCRELLINVTNLPLGMFCAGYEEGLRDACQGDSGGGMICGNTLVGVVSGGEGCARPALPGLYSDIPYYLNWIKYNVKNYKPEAYYEYKELAIVGKKEGSNNGSSTVYSKLSFGVLTVSFTLISFLGLRVSY